MKTLYAGLAASLAFAVAADTATAAGKKRAAPKAGVMKRAIQLEPINDRSIELPDPNEPPRRYGRNIYLELIDQLQRKGDYAIVLDPEAPQIAETAELAATAAGADPDPCIINTPPVASSRIRAKVDELSFTTGSRGERMLYGFQRGADNPYTSGVRNEFPLRTIGHEPGWFENEFGDAGGLHTGLELGHELNFDVLWVGATLKHAEYQASLGLDVEFENRFGESARRRITAKGNGFYFDLVAHLNHEGGDFLAGVMIARKVALLQAFERVIASAVQDVGREVSRLPLMARLAARCKGAYYVSAGANYRVPVGQRFYDLTELNAGRRPAVFTVEQVFLRSARVRAEGVAHIDAISYALNDELVSLAPGQKPPESSPRPGSERLSLERLSLDAPGLDAPVAARSLAAVGGEMASPPAQAREVNAGRADFGVPAELSRFVEGVFTRLWNGLKALVTLPYRIYRYYQYDQPYRGGELWQVGFDRAARLARASWANQAIGHADALAACAGSRCTDAQKRALLGSRSVIVAVVDSGIDYNHRELRRNIFWDGARDVPGWDFISGDARPYDDHAHGTEVASPIAAGGIELIGVAPNVTLLPLKVFSPYGLTNSGALYSAFESAVASGAKIIVTGWATQRRSQALTDALRLAAANRVLVVAATGDGGQDLERKPYYPAANKPEFPNLLVVAGYSESGALTRKPGLSSNYGKLVDLAAPGEDVPVANPRNGYETRSHTGIAAGFVAGAAALLWSRCPKNPLEDVRSALVEGARSLRGLNGEVPDNKALFLPGALDKMNQICK